MPDYGVVTCEDRFGTPEACAYVGIGLYDVDLFFATEAEAFEWGRKKVAIYVVR